MSLDLKAIKARGEAATLGPWKTEDPGPYIHSVWGKDHPDDEGFAAPVAKMLGPQDARFIVAARTDVPELVAEVELLREELRTTATILREAAMTAACSFQPENARQADEDQNTLDAWERQASRALEVAR